MDLIVLTRRRRIQRAVHLGGGAVACLAVAAVALLAGAVWLGMQLNPPEPRREDVRPDLYAAAMAKELAELRGRMEGATAGAQRDLDALALRLSELQARAIRIDALGGRLVELAGLDAGEFSFGEAPPRGGAAPSGDDVAPNSVADFVDTLAALERLLEARSQELEALETSLLSGRIAREVHPAGSPVVEGWISSVFGPRSDPITGERSMHLGVDFAGRRGSPIRTVAAGIVTFAGVRSGLGRVVEIDHGNGYTTRYAHNLKNLVRVGQRVAKGEAIAQMGSTGRSTGNHVHFEVMRDGRPLNPMTFIRDARNQS